ncbi:MAG: hypothetical protein M3Y27_14545 [Acidobacteriota bacterium]|nr:hypothetical protein [Acidobacteriota bacterium]
MKCAEVTGIEFQNFFEKIMVQAEKAFVAVKPMSTVHQKNWPRSIIYTATTRGTALLRIPGHVNNRSGVM